jgi:hypothetical protein
MIKSILLLMVGAAGAYLYMNPGDVSGLADMGAVGLDVAKDSINKGEVIVQQVTK